jgi:hypothetical protein
MKYPPPRAILQTFLGTWALSFAFLQVQRSECVFAGEPPQQDPYVSNQVYAWCASAGSSAPVGLDSSIWAAFNASVLEQATFIDHNMADIRETHERRRPFLLDQFIVSVAYFCMYPAEYTPLVPLAILLGTSLKLAYLGDQSYTEFGTLYKGSVSADHLALTQYAAPVKAMGDTLTCIRTNPWTHACLEYAPLMCTPLHSILQGLTEAKDFPLPSSCSLSWMCGLIMALCATWLIVHAMYPVLVWIHDPSRTRSSETPTALRRTETPTALRRTTPPSGAFGVESLAPPR